MSLISSMEGFTSSISRLKVVRRKQRSDGTYVRFYSVEFSVFPNLVSSEPPHPRDMLLSYVHAGWPGGQTWSQHTVQAGRMSLCVGRERHRSSTSTLICL